MHRLRSFSLSAGLAVRYPEVLDERLRDVLLAIRLEAQLVAALRLALRRHRIGRQLRVACSDLGRQRLREEGLPVPERLLQEILPDMGLLTLTSSTWLHKPGQQQSLA